MSFFVTAALISDGLQAQKVVEVFPDIQPLKSNDSVLAVINWQFGQEQIRNEFNRNDPVGRYYLTSKNALIRDIKQKRFSSNQFLNSYLRSILEKLEQGNDVDRKLKAIFINRSWTVNASTYNFGCVSVNLGLLLDFETEDAIAFALAHEMAHRILNHSYSQFVSYQERKNDRKKGNKFEFDFTAMQFEVSLDYLEHLKNEMNTFCTHSREHEFQADSLATIMIQNAGYSHQSSIEALTSIYEREQRFGEMGNRILSPLMFDQLPIQKSWIKNKLPILDREESTLFFNSDSILTHPRKEERILAVSNYFDSTETVETKSIPDLIKKLALREIMVVNYQNNQLDMALYFALLAKNKYPGEKYVDQIIAGSFLRLFEFLEINPMGRNNLVYRPTFHLSNDQKLINGLMEGISQRQMLLLGYLYLNSNKNFSDKNEEHFLMLYRISKHLDQHQMASEIYNQYSILFPSGKYLELMKK